MKNLVYQPNCVGSAWMCAWTARCKGYPVRMAVTKKEPGTDHVQAEAMIEGEWVPLTNLWDADGKRGQTDLPLGQIVVPWTRHYPDIEPYRYLSLEAFTWEQFEAVRG